MIRSKLLVIAVIILVLTVFLVAVYKKLPTSNRQTKMNYLVNFEATGILREMDLDEDLKTNRFIAEGRFQLTRLNAYDEKKLPYETSSVFIEKYPGNTADFIGKCVTIKGGLNSNWINKIDKAFEKNKFKYNALVFEATAVDKNDYDKCDGYKDYIDSIVPKDSKPITLSGVIRRQPRTVPDVGPYDYILMLTEPYTIQINSSGEPQKVEYMPIEPQNNDVWVKLENKVGKTTAVEAYELWGYFESKYLLVTRVME